jgi:hypothetical protein
MCINVRSELDCVEHVSLSEPYVHQWLHFGIFDIYSVTPMERVPLNHGNRRLVRFFEPNSREYKFLLRAGVGAKC